MRDTGIGLATIKCGSKCESLRICRLWCVSTRASANTTLRVVGVTDGTRTAAGVADSCVCAAWLGEVIGVPDNDRLRFRFSRSLDAAASPNMSLRDDAEACMDRTCSISPIPRWTSAVALRSAARRACCRLPECCADDCKSAAKRVKMCCCS